MHKITAFVALLLLTASCRAGEAVKFQQVIRVIEDKRNELSQHDFFKFIADKSVPASQRIRFAPYWTYFALAAADLLDSWVRIPDPQNEMERRVNVFVDEDNFHYNLFLHDVEKVLGYTATRFGSYGGVLRHLWGDDSRAVRMLIYSWAAGAKRNNDPMVALASFETIEAGLKDFFEATYANLFLAEDGYHDLKYFGKDHVELEMNHTLTSWFKEGDTPDRPLADYDISPRTKEVCLEVVEDMFYWLHQVYDQLHKLCLVENSIRPEKYAVNGLPPMHAFPEHHPGRNTHSQRDEL